MRRAIAASLSFFVAAPVGLMYAGWPRLAVGAPFVVVGLFCGPLVAYGMGLLSVAWLSWLLLSSGVLWYLCLPALVLVLPRPAQVPSQRWYSYVGVWILSGVVPLGASLAVRPACVEPFQVPAASMAPSLRVGDYFLVRRGVCRAEVAPGDVIVFEHSADPAVDYVKRVMAVGGQTISMHEGVVAVDGVDLAQQSVGTPVGLVDENCRASELAAFRESLGGHSYTVLADRSSGGGLRDYDPVTVPSGALFVLGDNRDNSSDSRIWGLVRMDAVKGVVGDVSISVDQCTGRLSTERVGPVP